MIVIHVPKPNGADVEGCPLERRILQEGEDLPENVLWIDLIEPTRFEDGLLERFLGVDIPTREEMRDLEPSELVYSENDTRYMTARVVCRTGTEQQNLTDVTFILTERNLITVRYDEPRAFVIFQNRVLKAGNTISQPEALLDGLIEAIIDRSAEIMRNIGDRIDSVSNNIFSGRGADVERGGAYQAILQDIGKSGQMISNVRESLISIERILLFLSSQNKKIKKADSFNGEWRTTLRDVQAIEEHASFLNNKVQFILEATLGLVGIEQNKIIKLFSVVSVVMMPPTLIASIYGMNFKTMPELNWELGYPFALVGMIIAAVVPYVFFRWRRWL